MSHLVSSRSHPSHIPPAASIDASCAQGSTAQDTGADAGFTLVLPRNRAANNRHPRDTSQPLISALLGASTAAASLPYTVSRDIEEGRAERAEQAPVDRQPSKATTADSAAQRATAGSKAEKRQNGRPSSSCATQHSISSAAPKSPTHPACSSDPHTASTSNDARSATTQQPATCAAEPTPGRDAIPDIAMHDNSAYKRCHDTACGANSTQEVLDNHGDTIMQPPSASSSESSSPAMSRAAEDGSGRGKRQCRTEISASAAAPRIEPQRVEIRPQADRPVPANWWQLYVSLEETVKQLQRDRTEDREQAKRREEKLQAEITRLQSAHDQTLARVANQVQMTNIAAPLAPTSAQPNLNRTVPMDTSPLSALAAAASQSAHAPAAPAPAGGAAVLRPRPKAHLSLRGRAVEPTAEQLQRASLPTTSTTDLVLSVRYAPLSTGSMRRRVHFPNHLKASKEERVAIGAELQDNKGLQIAPPRIPSFIMREDGKLHADRAQLMASLDPSSREHHYLQTWQLAQQSGDEFDLLQHAFSVGECVEGWAQLFSPSTQAFHPGSASDGLNVVFHLGFTDALITLAVRHTLAAHTARIREECSRRSGSHSPTPSTASTASSSSSSNPEPPSPQDARSPSRKVSLSPCALASGISVSASWLRYVCMTVSNWPREHPTELCGGDDQLRAFMAQRAPHLRLLTHHEYGSTSASTMVIGQKQHLAELLTLQGQSSPQHGISKPLHLNAAVHIMGAQTCTFCWSPGHGAGRCPRRNTAESPDTPVPAQAACRHCYSFEHHAAACRQAAATVTCKLCEETGHATASCTFFKPSKRPLRDFLDPAAALTAKRQAQAPKPAPILSATHVRAVQPWQNTGSSASPPAPAAMAQVAHPAYITQGQLTAALAPITAMLMQLMPLVLGHGLPQPRTGVELPLRLLERVSSLNAHVQPIPSPLQAPDATRTTSHGQQ